MTGILSLPLFNESADETNKVDAGDAKEGFGEEDIFMPEAQPQKAEEPSYVGAEVC